jgi:quercetin dioxygenase-like cupin family protein
MSSKAIIRPMTDVPAAEVPRSPGATIQVLLGPNDEMPNFHTRCFTLAPGARIPEHRHDTIEHEQVVLDGEMSIALDGDERVVRRDDCVYIPAGCAHWYENRGNVPCRFICIIPAGIEYGTEWLEE